MLPEARRERQGAAAQAYGEFLRSRTAELLDEERTLIESSNDIALRGTEW